MAKKKFKFDISKHWGVIVGLILLVLIIKGYVPKIGPQAITGLTETECLLKDGKWVDAEESRENWYIDLGIRTEAECKEYGGGCYVEGRPISTTRIGTCEKYGNLMVIAQCLHSDFLEDTCLIPMGEEVVCCKSGSYGSGMVEINVKYEQVFASECTPLGKGGFRKIVDMSYCEEECDSDDDCPDECQDCINGKCEYRLGCGTDEHGCIISAGYSWCEPKNRCIRSWEESCPEPGEISYYWHMYKWPIMMGIGVIFLLIILTRRRK